MQHSSIIAHTQAHAVFTPTYAYIFFFPSHLFPEFERRLATSGILPERLNRGHTEGSSPEAPTPILLRCWSVVSSVRRGPATSFPLCTHALALSTGKNESERKNSISEEKVANAGTRTHDLPARRLRGHQLDHRGDRCFTHLQCK